jgi:hypothetical protein
VVNAGDVLRNALQGRRLPQVDIAPFNLLCGKKIEWPLVKTGPADRMPAVKQLSDKVLSYKTVRSGDQYRLLHEAIKEKRKECLLSLCVLK